MTRQLKILNKALKIRTKYNLSTFEIKLEILKFTKSLFLQSLKSL